MRSNKVFRWVSEKLGKLIDEVVAGVIIALILGALSSVWFLLKDYLSNLRLTVSENISLIVFVVILFIVISSWIWKSRNRWNNYLPSESIPQDSRIRQLFVGRNEQISIFENRLLFREPEFGILWIDGAPGAGKSWLLEKMILICLDKNIPVAKVGLGEERLETEILKSFSRQLAGSGIKLMNFNEKVRDYDEIQAKLNKNSHQISKLAKIVTGIASTSLNPQLNKLATAIGPDVASQLGESAEDFLSREDAELYLRPGNKLAEEFKKDLSGIQKRVVLMFDTYELAEDLDNWIRSLTKKLSGNSKVLIVIAGRIKPNSFWKALPLEDWTLDVMDDVESLVCLDKYQQKYLENQLSEDEKKSIAQFCRGLPLAISSAIHVVRKYGITKFERQSQEVIREMVQIITQDVKERIKGDVDHESDIEILEVCAVLRWFDEDSIRYMTDWNVSTTQNVYRELASAPFTRLHLGGLALHDSFREWIGRDLHNRSRERWKSLHQKAAQYHIGRLEKIEQERRQLEDLWREEIFDVLYHKLQADEPDSLAILKNAFEHAQMNNPCYRSVFLALALSSEIFCSKYPGWICYFQARLNPDEFEAIEQYNEIINAPENDQSLQIYARASLGIIYFRNSQAKKAVEVLKENQQLIDADNLAGGTDKHIISLNRRYLASFSRVIGEYSYSVNLSKNIEEPRMLVEHARVLYYLGKYDQSEAQLRTSLREFEAVPHPKRYTTMAYRYLGHVLLAENKPDGARSAFRHSMEHAREDHDEFGITLAEANMAVLNLDIPELEKAVEKICVDVDQKKIEHQSTASRYTSDLASLYLQKGNLEQARKYFQLTLTLANQAYYVTGIIRAEIGMCDCAFSEEKYDYVNLAEDRIIGMCSQVEDWEHLAKLNYLKAKIAFLKNGSSDNREPLKYLTDALFYADHFSAYTYQQMCEIIESEKSKMNWKEMAENVLANWKVLKQSTVGIEKQ